MDPGSRSGKDTGNRNGLSDSGFTAVLVRGRCERGRAAFAFRKLYKEPAAWHTSAADSGSILKRYSSTDDEAFYQSIDDTPLVD